MTNKWFGIATLLLAASNMLACGSDSGDGGGAAAKASCNTYCDVSIAHACADSADCKSLECDGVDKATGACATEMKRYYDCMKAQADVCAMACSLDLTKCQ